MPENSFDDLVANIQNEIFEQAEQDFGQAFVQRWKDPQFMQKMELPDASACLTGSCGDSMEIYLQIENDTIVKASFFTSGCGASIVCGNTACEVAKNKDLEQAAQLSGEDVLQILGGLPKEQEHCAHLAIQTLREAIRIYWKR